MIQSRNTDWRNDPLVRMEKVLHELLPLAMGGRSDIEKAAFDAALADCLDLLDGGAVASAQASGTTLSDDQVADLAELSDGLREGAAALWELPVENRAAVSGAASELRDILEAANDILRDVFLTAGPRRRAPASEAAAVTRAVGDIQKISRQIRFISVNASIEAARVGEAGRGFSLIAQEIRQLAAETSAVLDRLSDEIEMGSR